MKSKWHRTTRRHFGQYEDLLESSKARISDISMEREKAVQQVQNVAAKSIAQHKKAQRETLSSLSIFTS